MGLYEAFYDRLWHLGIMPVVILEREDDALPLADALVAGGLPAAEVTFRTPVAAACIRIMHQAHPDLFVGAGTVLTCEEVDQTIEAGGSFVVSPGFDPQVVQYCLDRKIAVLPAAVTPTEIMAVRRTGLTVSKFFPAETFGGLAGIKALAAPFADHRFMPTGGISAQNVGNYLADAQVLACGGSWMVRPQLIAEGRFDTVQKLTREAVDTVRAVRG